jgi:hypothetical protein
LVEELFYRLTDPDARIIQNEVSKILDAKTVRRASHKERESKKASSTDSNAPHPIETQAESVSPLHSLEEHEQISTAVVSLPLTTQRVNDTSEKQMLVPILPPIPEVSDPDVPLTRVVLQKRIVIEDEEAKLVVPLYDWSAKIPPTEKQVTKVLQEIAQQKNLSSMVVTLLGRASSGDLEACNDLGLWCFENEQGEQKINHIFTLFACAAFKNIPYAQCNLGYCCYLYGDDSVRIGAQDWFIKAIIAGYTPAMNISSLCLSHKSQEKLLITPLSHQLLQKGAELGDWACMRNLATCYELGLGDIVRSSDMALQIRVDAINFPSHKDRNHLIKAVLYEFTKDDVVQEKPHEEE